MFRFHADLTSTQSAGYRFRHLVAGCIVLLGSVCGEQRNSQAITFTINYTQNEIPAFDPDGSQLRFITDAAAAIWSRYLPDNRNFEFDLSWDDLDDNTLGRYTPGFLSINTNIVLDTRDTTGAPRDWFFDPTPLDHSEFSLSQTIYRNLTSSEKPRGSTVARPICWK